MPQLLPWLAILALLALRPNHGWSAWWIWLPLACLACGWDCLQLGLQSLRSGLPNDVLNILTDVPRALAFGVAALWLLASRLGCRGRLGAFLGALLVLAGFGALSFAGAAGWGEGAAGSTAVLHGCYPALPAGWAEGAAQMVFLALLALVIAAAMVLCGFACRGRYLPFRLYPWLFVALVAVLFAVGAPVYVLARNALGGGNEWIELVGLVLVMAMVSFATLLPFLILSSASPFFRQRLKALLRVKPEAPPPLSAPLIDANLKT